MAQWFLNQVDRLADCNKPKLIGGLTPRASSSLGLESDLRIYISNKFLGSADAENQPLREPLLVIRTSDHVQPDSLLTTGIAVVT